MNYYLLKKTQSIIVNEIEKLIPRLSGEFVKNREEIFNDYKLHKKKVEFNYLLPLAYDDYIKIEFISDFHGWTNYEPNIYCFPISKKMKDILDNFNLYPNKFYPAKVLFKEEFHEYYVWQLFLDGFDKFIDFEYSTFCEYKFDDKVGDTTYKVNNEEELIDLELGNNWGRWGFERAVMKPEFKNIDCMAMPYPYGIVISERLKNALEEANLTGFEIKPFPVEFEYL